MKILNIIFIIVFIISALLQYNDPDPYLWMPIYLYGAFVCYLAVKGQSRLSLLVVGLVIYSAYAIYLLFDKTGVLNWAIEHEGESIVQSMKATKPWIEETREFFGLIILIFAFILNLRMVLKNKPSNLVNINK
jgi:hypothetical protein